MNKKNRFFTLLFSCCPGAGEMYMGLYQHGISLMTLFFGTIAVACWLGWEELVILICPVVWCYSFFHTHNLRRMTEEEFDAVEDGFFFENYVHYQPDWTAMEKHQKLMGVILAIIGLSMLCKTAMRLWGTFYYLPEIIYRLGYSIPQIAVAILILIGGIRLMREPKAEDFEEEETTGETNGAV